MSWFDRYVIPGLVFWGLLILWTAAFWNANFNTILCDNDHSAVTGGMLAASSLPVGYFISVLTQVLYLIFPWSPHGRAMIRANVAFPINDDWWRANELRLEVAATLTTALTRAVPLERAKFLQEWIRQRMAMMAMNSSSIIAGILAFMGALFIPCVRGWNWQLDLSWLLLAYILTAIILIAAACSWWLLSYQVTALIAGQLRAMAGASALDFPRNRQITQVPTVLPLVLFAFIILIVVVPILVCMWVH